MTTHRTLPLLLAPAFGLVLLAACTASSPTPDTAPAPAELASRAVAVDTGAPAEPVAALDVTRPPADEPPEEAVDDVEPRPLTTSWEVRRGESLAHFARWAELPVETLAEASGLSLSEALQVGDTVVIPGDSQLRAKVEQARQRHHQVRVEAYLATRGGSVGTSFHTVRTGETGWSVATRELGLPLWLIESYNPAVDLDGLRPGEQLLYPVLADSVASVDEPAEAADRDGATPASTEEP